MSQMFRSPLVTQTQLISSQIAYEGTDGEVQRRFVQTMVSEWESGDKLVRMAEAQRYYQNENDITEKNRWVIGRTDNNEPARVATELLANNKINHNFMKKLTRQKIGYMLGKPFTLISDKDEEDDNAREFFSEVRTYFGKSFHRMLKNVGRDSIVKSIGWVHPYYNENGDLKFMRFAPEEVIPLWADGDHTELSAFIRVFEIEDYTTGEKQIRKFADYYTPSGIYHYFYNTDGPRKGQLSPVMVGTGEEARKKVSPHFSARVKDDDGNYTSKNLTWGRVPLIPAKYDPDEQSLLSRIKDLVDEYDKRVSSIADMIDDHPNSVTVVRNYDGDTKEEFVHNKNVLRTIFVQGDGDAKGIDTPLNIEDIDVHLQRIRQDIYEFGQGVNTADKDIRDSSGVALRFLYADLDMDCIDWGSEMEFTIMSILWFIQQDILAKTGVDYTDVQYSVQFNTDVIVNESETIQNCFTSTQVISGETIASNHPWVKNGIKEMERLQAEQQAELEIEASVIPNDEAYGNRELTIDSTEGQRSAKTT